MVCTRLLLGGGELIHFAQQILRNYLGVGMISGGIEVYTYKKPLKHVAFRKSITFGDFRELQVK